MSIGTKDKSKLHIPIEPKREASNLGKEWILSSTRGGTMPTGMVLTDGKVRSMLS